MNQWLSLAGLGVEDDFILQEHELFDAHARSARTTLLYEHHIIPGPESDSRRGRKEGASVKYK